jgi:hypothetical protein
MTDHNFWRGEDIWTHKHLFAWKLVQRTNKDVHISSDASTPILSLNSDCLAEIVSLLNLSDMILIKLSGCIKLWTKIQFCTRNLVYNPIKCPFTQFCGEPITTNPFRLFSGFNRLLNIDLRDIKWTNTYRHHSPLTHLSPTLLHLTYQTHETFTESSTTLRFDFAEHFPSLVTLRLFFNLNMSYSDNRLDRSAIKWIWALPKTIRSLSLIHCIAAPRVIFSNLTTAFDDSDIDEESSSSEMSGLPCPALEFLEIASDPDNWLPHLSDLPASLVVLRSLVSPKLGSMNTWPSEAALGLLELEASGHYSLPLDWLASIPNTVRHLKLDFPMNFATSLKPKLTQLAYSLVTLRIPNVWFSLDSIEDLLPPTITDLCIKPISEAPLQQFLKKKPQLVSLEMFGSFKLSKWTIIDLPKSLTRLVMDFPISLGESQEYMRALPRRLTHLQLTEAYLEEHSLHLLPRSLLHLQVSQFGSLLQTAQVSLDGLPPTLQSLQLFCPITLCSPLPHSLRFFNVNILNLKPTPIPSLWETVKSSFGAKKVQSEGDLVDLLLETLEYIPSSCICQAQIYRDKRSITPIVINDLIEKDERLRHIKVLEPFLQRVVHLSYD